MAAAVALALAATAAAQDRRNPKGTSDTQTNPYNPIPQGAGSPPFGSGAPAGTRFGPDPDAGGGARPTDRQGALTTPERKTGAKTEEVPAPARRAKRARKRPASRARPADKRRKKAGDREKPDPELPAASPARQKDLLQEDPPSPAARPEDEVTPDSPISP